MPLASTRPQYVFVYGTLRADDHTTINRYRHDFNETVTETISGTTNGKLYFDKYPCVVPEEEGTIHGLLVTAPNFAELVAKGDKIEGTDVGLYEREETNVTTEDGRVVRAFIYVRRECDRSVVIETGNWITRDRLTIARREVLDALPTAAVEDVDKALETYDFNSRIAISLLRWKV